MNADEKTCPRCAETIKSAAVVCRFCGHEFGQQPAAGTPGSQPSGASLRSSISSEATAPLEQGKRQAGKIIGFGCLGFLILAVIISIASGSGSNSTNSAANATADMNATDLNAMADAAVANADAALNAAAAENSSSAGGWSYSSEKDEVRGGRRYFATIDSENQADFDFPYAGGSTLTMTVRKHPQYGQDVIFRISKGQFVCGVESCSGTINFGHGPQRISLTEPADYDSATLFASDGASIIQKLKTSDKVVVELPFFQEGNHQFTFNTKGLVWPPKE